MGDAALAADTLDTGQLTLIEAPAETVDVRPAPERPCLDGAQLVWEGDKPSQDRPGFRYPPGAGVDWEEWLSAEEEAELVQAAKAGDRQARAKLIRAHDPKVASVVLPWKWDSPWYEDLLQTGRLALLEALEGFDPERGVRFGPYAGRAVQNAVWDKAALLKHPLEPNREAMRFRRKAKRARRRFQQEHHRDPWYGELAPMLFPEEWPEGEGLDPERVEKANALIDRVGLLLSEIDPYTTELDDDGEDRRHSTEKPNARTKDDASPASSLHELAEGSDPATYPDPFEGATGAQEDRDRQEARGSMVADLLDAVPLTDRMRFCVRGVLGLDGDGFRTPKDLAEELSEGVEHTVRPDSVQRTLRRAARRIREHMAGADVEAVDPFSAEEQMPDRGLLDAFAVAREEEPARWAAAVREVLGEQPARVPNPFEGTRTDCDRVEAGRSRVADILDSVPGLTDRMRFCVQGVLGLDGGGFKTPGELAEERYGGPPWSVRQTLEQAAKKIRAHLEGAEEWLPEPGFLDAFAEAQAEEPAGWQTALWEAMGQVAPIHGVRHDGRSTPRRIGPPPKAGHHIDLPWTRNK